MTFPLNITSQDFFRNPADEIERLRSAGLVLRIKFPIVGKVWITTTQELAGRVLKDRDSFLSWLSTRAYRGQMRAAGSFDAMGEARDGRACLANQVA